jgi:uncharacterized membrane protein YcaP (DUF421 family)
MDFLWESAVLVMVGMILLRISGRKSIAQMTIAQTVVMISIGAIIVQPIVEKSVWKTVAAAAVFVAFLLLIEMLSVKVNFMEKLMVGKSVVVIKDGKPQINNMRKLRLSVDQLESQLRQKGIERIEDVRIATLESNGLIGYELMRHAKPVTVGELEKMLGYMAVKPDATAERQNINLFDEVVQKSHNKDNPGQLQ